MNELKEFITAVLEGRFKDVQRLFKKEFINMCYQGRNALQRACEYDYVEIVQYLIDEGFDIDFSDKGGQSLIHIAVCQNHKTTLKILINAGCSLECHNEQGETPLDVAIRKENDEFRQILELASASEKRVDEKELKNKGLFTKMDNETGRTLLDKLLTYQDHRIIEKVKSKPIDEQELKVGVSNFQSKIQVKNSQSHLLMQECLLWMCMKHKYYDGFHDLCTAEIVNKDSLFLGPSALETAVQFGTVIYVKVILEKLVEENDTWTRAIHYANQNHLPKISSLISDKIRFLNKKKKIGFSPLHIAVLNNDPDLIYYILKNKKVNSDEVHTIFGTALVFAKNLNQKECWKIIQDNPTAKVAEKENPIVNEDAAVHE